MDELIIEEQEQGNEAFRHMAETLCSFGVAISIKASGDATKRLPAAYLNGVLMKEGVYPTKQELIDWMKIPLEFFEDETTGCSLNEDGCCGCGCCYE